MTIESDFIQFTIDEHVATVTFDRPEKYNSLNTEMKHDAVRAIRSADENNDVRTIVVTGAGDSFCSGADLQERIPKLTGDNPDVWPGDHDLFFRHELITTPIVAAVNGYCLAGGMEFLQACDIRIASEEAKFGLPEPKWGLSPIAGSQSRLPRQIPYCHAMKVLLTGESLTAEEALSAGIVNEVHPEDDVLDRAYEIAGQIAENSPNAVQKIKETVERGLNRPIEDSFRLETELARDVFRHKDAEEGPKAFLEDRQPEF